MVTRALLLAVALLALLAPGAGAHATLQATVPERGAALDAAPASAELRFNEPVEVALGAVRVYDADGTTVQEGDAFHPRGEGTAVAVKLAAGLADGAYTVTYRVVSADSHPITGGFVFGVGPDAAAPAAGVADLLGDQDAGPVTSFAFTAARTVQYGAIALALGLLALVLTAWLPALRAVGDSDPAWTAASEAFAARARTLLLAASAAGVLSGGLALVLQGATAEGSSFWTALDSTGDVLKTRFGTVWGLGVMAWLTVGAVASLAPAAVPVLRPAVLGAAGTALPGGGLWLAALAPPLIVLALLPGLGGHAGAQDPVAVLLPANVLHVLAASAWIGGLAALVLALPAATRRLDPPARTRLLAATLARFSALALVAVAALLTGGIVQSLLELGAVGDLLDTAYGRAILVKSALVAALLVFGAFNRRRILPALGEAARKGEPPGRTGRLLHRSLRGEVGLGVAALIATGALAGYAPATAATSGPFSASADLGPARAELTVEPAQAGPNEIHLYLFDRAGGAQYDEAQELTLFASLPERDIEPIELEARKAGPGHYVAGGAALAPGGTWKLEVAARVSEFDEHRAAFDVPVG